MKIEPISTELDKNTIDNIEFHYQIRDIIYKNSGISMHLFGIPIFEQEDIDRKHRQFLIKYNLL